jgi:hypothetical protein
MTDTEKRTKPCQAGTPPGLAAAPIIGQQKIPETAPVAACLPADLEKIVASWATLPEHIRAAMLALVGVASAR